MIGSVLLDQESAGLVVISSGLIDEKSVWPGGDQRGQRSSLCIRE
jgi:hypothetical protein